LIFLTKALFSVEFGLQLQLLTPLSRSTYFQMPKEQVTLANHFVKTTLTQKMKNLNNLLNI